MAKQKAQNSVETTSTEEQTFSFNLVTKPWIKVLKDDGTNEMLSLKSVFEQADSIIELSNENVYVDASITLLLFAIVYTAYSRHKELKQRILSSGKFEYDAKTIVDYLVKHEDLFDLYDKERPFLQVTPDMELTTFAYVGGKNGEGNKTGKSLKILTDNKFSLRDSDTNRTFDKLNAFSSSLNKKSQWSLEIKITDEIVARNFITYRLWHTASNGTPRVSTGLLTPPTNKGSFALTFIKGSSLKDLFSMNFKADNLNEEQKPMWEINPVDEWKELYEHRAEMDEVVYYDILNAGCGIARILTYSNVNLYLDKSNGIFRFGYRVPAKLFSVKTEGNKDKKVVSLELKTSLNVISTDAWRNYSVAKNILDDENFDDAKQVSIIRPPEYNKTSMYGTFDEVFTTPITLIGNGALKADVSEDVSTLHNDLRSLCSDLEKIATEYNKTKLGKITSLLKKQNKMDVSKAKKGIYEELMNRAASCVENDFCDLSIQYADCGLDADILEMESNKIKSKARRYFQNAYNDFIRNHCTYLFYALEKGMKAKAKKNQKPDSNEQNNTYNDKNDKGDFTMSNYADRQIAAKNFNFCVKQCYNNPVDLRDMRNGKYILKALKSDEDAYDTISDKYASNKHDLHMMNGIEKALHLWANHKHDMKEESYATVMHTENDTVSYKETFGYVMYLKSLSMSNDEWEKEMSKYELASHNLDKLVRYMRLTIKDVLKTNSLQLDYARFAYHFSRILANKESMKDFLRENMLGFSLAKKAMEPIENKWK